MKALILVCLALEILPIFQLARSGERLKQDMSQYDKDNDGLLSINEFIVGARDIVATEFKMKLSEDFYTHLRNEAKMFADNNGKMTPEAYGAFWKKIAKRDLNKSFGQYLNRKRSNRVDDSGL